jgi:hypothetical protein
VPGANGAMIYHSYAHSGRIRRIPPTEFVDQRLRVLGVGTMNRRLRRQRLDKAASSDVGIKVE